jgi:dihydrofolate reductase
MSAIDGPEVPPGRGAVKVQYFTATTLDGFIADDDNSLDWLFVVERDEDDPSWEEFIGGVGAMAMGATTYEWVLGHEPEMLEGPDRWRAYYADRPCWVFTHRELPRIPEIDLRFVQGDVRAAYDEMVAAVGRRAAPNIWVVGGGDLVGQFDDAGLLDEIRLGVTPVTLGSGAPVLPRRITSERLRLRSVGRSGQLVNLVYDVSRRSSSRTLRPSR